MHLFKSNYHKCVLVPLREVTPWNSFIEDDVLGLLVGEQEYFWSQLDQLN